MGIIQCKKNTSFSAWNKLLVRLILSSFLGIYYLTKCIKLCKILDIITLKTRDPVYIYKFRQYFFLFCVGLVQMKSCLKGANCNSIMHEYTALERKTMRRATEKTSFKKSQYQCQKGKKRCWRTCFMLTCDMNWIYWIINLY